LYKSRNSFNAGEAATTDESSFEFDAANASQSPAVKRRKMRITREFPRSSREGN
jgi:hypothetical protein